MRYCEQCGAEYSPYRNRKNQRFCSLRRNKRWSRLVYQAEYRRNETHRAEARARAQRYYSQNPAIFAARSKAYREKVPHKLREWNVKAKYGLTMAQLVAMGPSCHICGDVFTSASANARKRQHIDHDHATNKVRGLLCQSCNQGLGNFMDDPGRLLKAIQYLAQHSAKEIEFTA